MNSSQSLVCWLDQAVTSAQSYIAYWLGSTQLKECGLTHSDLSEMQGTLNNLLIHCPMTES